MGVLAMGSQGGSSCNEKQSQFQALARQNSIYGLTLDEVENQLGELGKPLSSMNLDELLKNVWTAEANQCDIAMPLSGELSKKTVDEVWRDIQQGKYEERKCQPSLGEMTLEDFLVKAGIVAEARPKEKGTSPAVEFPQPGQWMQCSQQPHYQHPQQSMMGVYMPLHMGPGPVMDVSYPENQMALPAPLPGRKRGIPEDVIEKTVERRQKRMIKNRESAARSRARKQAYTNELENKVSRLEEENERLRKRKELEKMLPSAPLPEPKYQLRRTTSAPL